MPSSPPRRLAGLDGLRALAVILVVASHLAPQGMLAGGFIGVDVFFVISGYLITTLLMRTSPDGRIGWRRLADFWRRRARRLLPALALVVTVSATVAWMIGGDVLVGLPTQVLGAATFSYNWMSLAAGTNYFSSTAPELLRNVWSLAVEEQFYVLWPLLLPVLLFLPGRVLRTLTALALAGASAWWMAQLSADDVTRAYFGTDSHAFGLLIGIALGMSLRPGTATRGAVARGILGVVGLAVVVGAALLPETDDARTFPGALLIASLGTAAVIIACADGGRLARMLDSAIPRWIGERSYGIYLWHWPVLVLLGAASGGAPDTVLTGMLAVAFTVVLAAASYRWVEVPIRRRGLRASVRALGGRLRGTPAVRAGALAGVASLALAVGGTGAALASVPVSSSAEAYIVAGQAALNAQAASQPASMSVAETGAAVPAAVPAPDREAIDGTRVSAVGDSVMLASAPALLSRLPGITIDAAVSRSFGAGVQVVADQAAAGVLRDIVVVALGTNGPVDTSDLERLREIVGPDRLLVLVDAFGDRSWIPGVNASLAAYADAHKGIVLADWAHTIAPHPDLLAGDGIHPGERGGKVFSAVVQRGVEAAMREIEPAEPAVAVPEPFTGGSAPSPTPSAALPELFGDQR